MAPDFFEYFRALYPILSSDPTLWCISAWNDNGRDGLVDPGKADLLYRTDFFPGLGWMLLKEVWAELEPKWPKAFWDDWMRQPEQRKDRSCIRPEISRTITFGRKGVSLGQFFDQYLRYIKLNTEFVPFTKLDLSYLVKEKYDETFEKEVYIAPLVKVEELQQGGSLKGSGPFRVQYSSRDSFKVLARNLGVMDDLKSGVPRAGYRGVVSFISRGRRIYLGPPEGWTKYDTSWSWGGWGLNHKRQEIENSQLLLQVKKERNALSNQRKQKQGVKSWEKLRCEYKITAVLSWKNFQACWEQHKRWCIVFAQQSCNNLPSEKIVELRCKQLLCRIAYYDMKNNDHIFLLLLDFIIILLLTSMQKAYKRSYILSYHSVFWENLTITHI